MNKLQSLIRKTEEKNNLKFSNKDLKIWETFFLKILLELTEKNKSEQTKRHVD